MSEILPEKKAEITDAIFAGRKIEAIKLYREATGLGLKESKEFVEALQSRLQQDSPEKFTTSSGGGCATVLACLVLGATLVYCGVC
jgi:hypothetical protein